MIDYDRVSIGKPLRQYEFSVNPTARNSESPLERYQRLRADVESLRSDLKTVEESSPDLELEQGNKANEIANQLNHLQSVLDQCETLLQRNGTLVTSAASSNITKQLMLQLQSLGLSNDEQVWFILLSVDLEL